MFRSASLIVLSVRPGARAPVFHSAPGPPREEPTTLHGRACAYEPKSAGPGAGPGGGFGAGVGADGIGICGMRKEPGAATQCGFQSLFLKEQVLFPS